MLFLKNQVVQVATMANRMKKMDGEVFLMWLWVMANLNSENHVKVSTTLQKLKC